MYSQKYIIKASTLLNEYYEISLDYLDYVGSVTELKATKKFLQLRSTTGDENRLEPIIGTEALIQIDVSESDQITIVDLIATHDSDIKVTVTRIDQATGDEFIHFQGFVVVEDNNQPFLDPPFLLNIRALDGIGLLKGVDLLDTTGAPFDGSQTVIEWIGQILYKTNQDIPVRAYFNFFPLNFAEISALAEITLNAITFKTGTLAASTDPSIDVNAANQDDCYTALEKIIRCFRCRLFFEDGVFMIVNLQEYANPTYNFTEYVFGTPVGGIVPMNPTSTGTKKYDSKIGKAEIIYPVNKDAILYLKLAYKYVKLNYNYDQSQNKICNQDFAQGARNVIYDEVISSSVIDTTIDPVVNLTTRGYDLFCWSHFDATNTQIGIGTTNGFPNVLPESAPSKRAFIREVLDALSYTLERFAVIDCTGDQLYSHIKSSTFLIDTNDRLNFSVNWRLRTQQNYPIPPFDAFGATIAMIFLIGTDGTFWALKTDVGAAVTAPTAEWVSCDSNFHDSFGDTPAIRYIPAASNDDAVNWINVALPAPVSAPVSGNCNLYLMSGKGSTNEAWHKDVTLDITPYLIGTYTALKGDYNLSLNSDNIKQSDTETVEISDSPKRYFKGALLNPDGVTLIPADWHRRGQDEHLRFTQAMEKTIFNLLSRMVYKIEGTFKGLVYLDNDDFTIARPIGYLNSYFFVDGNFPFKKFIQTSFDIDVYAGEGRRVFVEVLQDENDSGWDSPDTFKFDYIFQ